MNGRVWHISRYDHDAGVEVMQDFYDRDEVAKFLHEMDCRGYFISRWNYQCFANANELVRVNLQLEFGNWQIGNIPEDLDFILGN